MCVWVALFACARGSLLSVRAQIKVERISTSYGDSAMPGSSLVWVFLCRTYHIDELDGDVDAADVTLSEGGGGMSHEELLRKLEEVAQSARQAAAVSSDGGQRTATVNKHAPRPPLCGATFNAVV